MSRTEDLKEKLRTWFSGAEILGREQLERVSDMVLNQKPVIYIEKVISILFFKKRQHMLSFFCTLCR